MLTINVAPDGSGQFTTISEAVLAVPYDCPAVIRIAPGIYREKLVCEKKDITLAGAGMDATRLVWNDGGKLPHPDGRPTHTFRSYTAFFSGEKLRVEDMTIENDAGPGAKAGQAIAAYVDSARAAFSRVRLLGNQDTLFCAPLPEKEREMDGFLGPRGLAPRRASAQYYYACEIAGDIDFIFGGADALFEHCTLRTVNNGLAHSWVTAPSGAMCVPRRQSSTAVLPVGRHGLPRYTLPAGQSETKSQSQNTKPSPSAAPEGAVTQLCARPLSTVRRVQCSNRASAPPKIKSMSPAISQAW